MRFRIFHKGLVLGAVLGIMAAAPAGIPAADSSFASFLKSLLEEGIHKRASLSQIERMVQQARRQHPDDPVIDYAHGLVLLSRVQPAEAAQRFEAALKRDPAYLPAWQALLRTRLLRKEGEALKTETLKLALLVGKQDTAWADDGQRQEAARWLGRAAGFLALPEVDLWDVNRRSRHESALKSRLGNQFAAAFAEGRQSLLKDYEDLQQDIEQEISQAAEDQQQKAEQELADLKDRGEELDDKSESLKMSAEQWQEWVKQQTTQADQAIKKLQKDYIALDQTARGVSRLIQQTQVGIGRLRTQLAASGIRGPRAEGQPAMAQLAQELLKYQTQHLTLQNRAAGILSQGRRVLAARAAAVRKYQTATGDIVQQTRTIAQWSKTVEKTSQDLKTKPNTALERSRKKRLTQVASYFELDEAAELGRLIQQAGGIVED